MKTVIYHSADYDGIFCREIAKRFLGTEGVNYIGWNFGDAKIPMPKEGMVFILDLSPDCLEGVPEHAAHCERLIWIDHHKSSIEKWSPTIPGYRIDGVAACRLAWQWFKHWVLDLNDGHGGINNYWVPSVKQDFIDRKVLEPLAVRLAGEYDVWDKNWMEREPRILQFQYGLKSYQELQFDALLDLGQDAGTPGVDSVERILCAGSYAQNYAENMDAFWLAEAGHIFEWEGLKFLAKNTVERGSNMFRAKDMPQTGHDALLAYGFRGKIWTVSLYHAKHRTDLDLSQIAVKHGGGGHRGACGFTCQKLPFLT